MVIVHIVSSVLYGGVGSVVEQLVLEQRKKNKIIIVSFDNTSDVLEKIGNGITHFQPKKISNIFPTIFGLLNKKIIKTIDEENKDEDVVFHFHNTISFGLLFRIKNKFLICTLHGKIISNNWFSKLITKLTIKRMMNVGIRLVCVSEDCANYYNNLFNTKKFTYIHNGVGISVVDFNKYNINTTLVNFVFVGHLDELKGWKYAFDAFSSLEKDTRSKAAIHFVGDCSKKDLNTISKCSNFNGAYFYGQIKDLRTCFLPFCDVLVLPSRTEGLPMSILEAQSCSIPAIATNVGGIKEIIVDEFNGYFCRRDSDNIKKIYENIINNPGLLNRLKNNARIIYSKKFTSEAMVKKYYCAYEQINKNIKI